MKRILPSQVLALVVLAQAMFNYAYPMAAVQTVIALQFDPLAIFLSVLSLLGWLLLLLGGGGLLLGKGWYLKCLVAALVLSPLLMLSFIPFVLILVPPGGYLIVAALLLVNIGTLVLANYLFHRDRNAGGGSE